VLSMSLAAGPLIVLVPLPLAAHRSAPMIQAARSL
jgi:hypothetical protein